MTDKERIARYAKLELSPAEAQALCEYDKSVEHTNDSVQLEYDLDPIARKVAQKFTHTGTRKPTVYKFTKRERKPNATKEGIISELAKFLEENSDFEITNLVIANKSKLITFTIGGKNYKLDLIENRK